MSNDITTVKLSFQAFRQQYCISYQCFADIMRRSNANPLSDEEIKANYGRFTQEQYQEYLNPPPPNSDPGVMFHPDDLD